MSSTLLIKAANLHYGAAQALYGVTIEARPGRFTAVLGRNWRGQELDAAGGDRHQNVSAGEIISTRCVRKARLQAGAHGKSAYVPQGREILRCYGQGEPRDRVCGAGARRQEHSRYIFTLFPVLKSMLGRRGGDLSGGQPATVAIGRALVTRTKVLVWTSRRRHPASIIRISAAPCSSCAMRRGLTTWWSNIWTSAARSPTTSTIMDRGQSCIRVRERPRPARGAAAHYGLTHGPCRRSRRLPPPIMQARPRRGPRDCFGARWARRRLRTLYQEGAAKIRLPHTHSDALQAVLMNTAGGLTGGDHLRWTAVAQPGAKLVLTTPACERAYRSTGADARVENRLVAHAGAHIDWLPQETILFEGSRLDRSLDVELGEDATLTAVEACCSPGAMGEAARNAKLRDKWRIRRGGTLIHAEATVLSADAAERDGLSLLGGALAFATVLHIAPNAERRLDAVRALLPESGGASVIGERLTVRLLAANGLALRRSLAPIIALLSSATSIPRLWTF